VQKHKSVTLTDFVVSQTVTIGERKISPKSDIKKKVLPTPTTPNQIPSTTQTWQW